jgi:hypothetical protein
MSLPIVEKKKAEFAESDVTIQTEEFETEGETKKSDGFLHDTTMRFLVNKLQYSKYLLNSNPEKHTEQEKQLQKIRKYEKQIIQITDDLLRNTSVPYSYSVEHSFNKYVQLCIEYIETKKEMETVDDDGVAGGEDDVLFSNFYN